MVLDKNTSPYYDDYNENKNFYQILFRPGLPVQARELSQLQSIVQKQVDRFGKHVFKEGSMVIPGAASIDFLTNYVKLEQQYSAVDIDVEDFKNKIVCGTTSGAIAKVIDVEAVDGADPNTLYINYLVGTSQKPFTASITNGSTTVSSVSINTNTLLKAGMKITGVGIPSNTYIRSITNNTTIVLSNPASATNGTASLNAVTSEKFEDGEDVVTVDGVYQATAVNDSNGSTGFGSRVQVKRGVYFALGYFLLIDDQSLIVSKYSSTPSYKIGLRVVESIVTSEDDVSLFDPATGSTNFNAPGADRYSIDLQLSAYDIDDVLPDNFIELIRVVDGNIQRLVENPDYAELEKTLARRTNDESGSYTVKSFPLQIKEHLNDGTNFGVYSESNGGDETKLIAAVEAGKAYVQGFEIESRGTRFIEFDKARDTAFKNNATIPFNMGNYVIVDNVDGIFNISTYEEVQLLSVDKANGGYPGTVLGTARVRAVEFVSGTPGNAAAIYRLYLFKIAMNSDSNGPYQFSATKAIRISSNAKSCDVVLNVDSEAVLYDVQNNTPIVVFEESAIKSLKDSLGASDTSYTVKRYLSGTMTGSALTLTAGTNEIFSSYSVTNYQVAIITASGTATGNGFAAGDVINIAASGNSITLGGSPTGKQITVTVPSIAGSTIAVLATLTKTEVVEKTKTLTTRSQTIAHASTIQLDRADIFDIVSILDLTTVGNPDVKDRYILDNGQRDNFYDRGSLTYKPGFVTISGNVQVNYRFFAHGSGDYFSVDSYDGVIPYDDIYDFTSPTTGTLYQLRNCADFRPRINDAGTGFSVTSEIVAPGQNFRADYEYYLARRDRVVLDQFGNFYIVKGIPSKKPNYPSVQSGVMVLYELTIPAYTFSTSSVVLNRVENKRYTMRDIGKLEQRIENLEYYTTLSLLEIDTASLFIDDGTGANRFKSGFLVDNFTSHLVGNPTLPEYQCSIDGENKILRSPFSSDSVKMLLSVSDSSNYQKTGDLITLPYTTGVYIDQQLASKIENVNPYDVINWIGNVTLVPSSDEWFETQQAADRIITNDDGTANALASLNGQTSWNDWQTTWTGTTSQVTARDNSPRGWETVVVTNSANEARTGTRLSVVETITSEETGNRIVSTDVIPWIRENLITFSAKLLKPNTKVFPYFDNVLVTEYVTPTGGSLGGELISNSSGEVSGTFAIPNNSTIRFRTGERVFRLIDSENNNTIFATTVAEGEYTATGTLQTQQNTITSTRTAQLVSESITENRTIILSQEVQRNRFGGPVDPVAQTFFVQEAGGVFLSKIDVYVATKDTKGIPLTIQIRNVINGYPGKVIAPFSEVTLNPSSINVSEDASLATSFVFPSPVYLEEGEEYCFVLLANSIEYTIWCARLGEFDITSGQRITKQPYTGVMFKSQNASTWTADQEQDIKFTIHKCNFNTAVTGTVVFKNDAVRQKTLPSFPFLTTSGSPTLLVNFPNHGLLDTNEVTISGVTANVNGIPFAQLNATHVINYIDFDTFEITVATNATATGLGGGNAVKATPNLRADIVNPLIETLLLTDTSMEWGLKLRDDANTLDTEYAELILKENLDVVDEKFVYNADNESASKSAHLRATLTTSNSNISPVIDTERASLIVVSNRINNSSTGETNANSGDAISRYITRKISLTTPATSARVYFAAIRPIGSNIKVYIKYLKDSEADIVFDSLPYTELTQISYPSEAESYNDYIFEIDNLETFSNYSIKIVMTSDNTSNIPQIRDFRTIALAT